MDKNFVRLQRIQNAAARFIVRVLKSASVTPVLRDLRWLSVRERARFAALVQPMTMRMIFISLRTLAEYEKYLSAVHFSRTSDYNT